MKKIIYTFILISAFVFTSCEEDIPIYDGAQTLAYFDGNGAQLSVPIRDASATITVPVNVSTLSSSDRTITISVVDSETSADPSMYSFNTSVTVPANTYFTSFEITGLQNGLSQTGDTLTLQIDGVDDGGVGSVRTYEVVIIQTCPFVFTDFIGTFSQNGSFDGGAISARPDVVATQGPEENLLLLTNVWATGRQAMIEFDRTDPNTPALIHRSQDFDAVFAVFGTFPPTYTEDVLGNPERNVYNTCTLGFSLSFNRRIGPPDNRFFTGTYELVFLKL